jgi:hypothetical protein
MNHDNAIQFKLTDTPSILLEVLTRQRFENRA